MNVQSSESTVTTLPITCRSASEIDGFMARLATLDLEPIVYKLVMDEESTPWSVAQADDTVLLYKDFLLLCYMFPDHSIVPTKNIDQVWHTHVLDTAKYREDCIYLFGHFLDHFPYFGLRGQDDAVALKAAFEQTKLLFLTYGHHLTAETFSACGSDCGASLCEPQVCDSNACTVAIMHEKVRPRLERQTAKMTVNTFMHIHP